MKIPPGCLVAFAVFYSIFAAAPCNAADDKSPATPPLAVVRTWGDLIAQKPVMIQPPAKDGQPAPAPVPCKLGISGATADRYSGVVLYCLVEDGGKDPDTLGGPDALGPFAVNILEPADIQIAKEAQEKWAGISDAKKSARLYMKTVPLGIVGDYHIEVRELTGDLEKPDSRPVAGAVVKVADKTGTFWFPWSDPDKEPGETPGLVDEGDYSLMKVANPTGGFAVPRWNGDMAVDISKIPGEKQPLPQITPVDTDAGVQLSIKGSQLTVKLADDEMSTYYPDEHFLTHWWVNGKPVQLKADAGQQRWARALGAAEKLVKEVRFQMEFHPGRLGVKKGDTVGLQLLFCPQGWDGDMAEADAIESMKQDKPEPWRISRMSNRVDFVYSGNPASVAQGIAP